MLNGRKPRKLDLKFHNEKNRLVIFALISTIIIQREGWHFTSRSKDTALNSSSGFYAWMSRAIQS